MTSCGNESAFPEIGTECDESEKCHRVYSTGGMTIRTYAAIKAMQGIMNNHSCKMTDAQIEAGEEIVTESGHREKCPYGSYDGVAEEAVRFADALIAELSKGDKNE